MDIDFDGAQRIDFFGECKRNSLGFKSAVSRDQKNKQLSVRFKKSGKVETLDPKVFISSKPARSTGGTNLPKKYNVNPSKLDNSSVTFSKVELNKRKDASASGQRYKVVPRIKFKNTKVKKDNWFTSNLFSDAFFSSSNIKRPPVRSLVIQAHHLSQPIENLSMIYKAPMFANSLVTEQNAQKINTIPVFKKQEIIENNSLQFMAPAKPSENFRNSMIIDGQNQKRANTKNKLLLVKKYQSLPSLPAAEIQESAASERYKPKADPFQANASRVSAFKPTLNRKNNFSTKDYITVKENVDQFKSLYIQNGEDFNDKEIKKKLKLLLGPDYTAIMNSENGRDLLEMKLRELVQDSSNKNLLTTTFEESISLGHLKSILYKKCKNLESSNCKPESRIPAKIYKDFGNSNKILETQDSSKSEKQVSTTASDDLKGYCLALPGNSTGPLASTKKEVESRAVLGNATQNAAGANIADKNSTSTTALLTSNGTSLLPVQTTSNLKNHAYISPIALSLKGFRSKRFLFNTPLGEYKPIKTLGQGSYGKVKLVKNTLTQVEYAVKIIKRYSPKRHKSTHPDYKKAITLDQRVIRESNLSKILGELYPHIVPLYDFRMTDKYFYLFYEYVDGPTLAERVGSSGVSEEEAKLLFRPIAEAIRFCHSFSIIHRDIKLENILIDYTVSGAPPSIESENGIPKPNSPQSSDNPHKLKSSSNSSIPVGFVKLIDFGLANFFTQDGHMETFCGSLPYTAPEILRGDQYNGPEIDIWSLGVLLFVVLNGKFPFDDPSDSKNFKKILEGDFEIRSDLSIELQKLLVMMLEPDVSLRLTIDQVLSSSWFDTQYNQDNFQNNKPQNCCQYCSFHSNTKNSLVPTPEKDKLVFMSKDIEEKVVREVATCLDISVEKVIRDLKSAKIDQKSSTGISKDKTEKTENGYLYQKSPIVSMYYLISRQIEHRRWFLLPHKESLQERHIGAENRDLQSQIRSQINHGQDQAEKPEEVEMLINSSALISQKPPGEPTATSSSFIGKKADGNIDGKKLTVANKESSLIRTKPKKYFAVVNKTRVRKIGFCDGVSERIVLPKRLCKEDPLTIVQSIAKILESNGTVFKFAENILYPSFCGNQPDENDDPNSKFQSAICYNIDFLGPLWKSQVLPDKNKNKPLTESNMPRLSETLMYELLSNSNEITKFKNQTLKGKIKTLIKLAFPSPIGSISEIDAFDSTKQNPGKSSNLANIARNPRINQKSKLNSLLFFRKSGATGKNSFKEGEKDEPRNGDKLKDHHEGTLPQGFVWETKWVRGKNRRVMVPAEETGMAALSQTKSGKLHPNTKKYGVPASSQYIISLPVEYPTTTITAQHSPSLNYSKESEALEHYSCSFKIELVVISSVSKRKRYAVLMTRLAGHRKKFALLHMFLKGVVNSL